MELTRDCKIITSKVPQGNNSTFLPKPGQNPKVFNTMADMVTDTVCKYNITNDINSDDTMTAIIIPLLTI